MATPAASTAATAAAREGSPRAVAVWLIGCAGMTLAMIVIGGATRLTRSGLSMVDWRPQGSALPSTDEEWQREFDKYKAFPEFKRVNSQMTVEEFKEIYFMEWFHRMWGRAIGVAFAVPFLGFALTRSIPPGIYGRLAAAFGLGGLQGAVGWWMVRSGLDEKLMTTDEPRVNSYRLTTHLSMAVGIFSLLMWTAMDLLARAPAAAARAAAAATPEAARAAARLRPVAIGAAVVAGCTLASGGFVAGLDAGHAYNDWPMMAGRFVPEQYWDESLGWRNFFENTATVQFDHRMLAYSTLLSAGAVLVTARRGGAWKHHTPRVRRGVLALVHAVGAQAALGISTLVMYVPVPLAACHQAGALVVWSSVLTVLHALRAAAPRAASAARAASKAV